MSIPNQALNDIGPRRYRRVGPAEIVQLLQGVDVHSDRDRMIHVSAPFCVFLRDKRFLMSNACEGRTLFPTLRGERVEMGAHSRRRSCGVCWLPDGGAIPAKLHVEPHVEPKNEG